MIPTTVTRINFSGCPMFAPRCSALTWGEHAHVRAALLDSSKCGTILVSKTDLLPLYVGFH